MLADSGGWRMGPDRKRCFKEFRGMELVPYYRRGHATSGQQLSDAAQPRWSANDSSRRHQRAHAFSTLSTSALADRASHYGQLAISIRPQIRGGSQ